jgi:arylsulfatase A-like enzyme
MKLYLIISSLLLATLWTGCEGDPYPLPSDGVVSNSGQNVIYILSDDHRYDFMGFMQKVPFLRTPNMDRMAAEGVHLKNAFVTTSLCSPSRASILTGQYTHRHGVVDNQSMVPEGTDFFPEFLQEAGYETGYIGKWHMGEHNSNPRQGFDYWASFKGQGQYWNSVFNVNGVDDVPTDSTYVTHAITDYARDFLNNRDTTKPFFLYVSHKSVHAEFTPAPEHDGVFEEEALTYPATFYPPSHPQAQLSEQDYNYDDLPQWVKEQRHSWHGVDYLYHGEMDFDEFYRSYCETLIALDESIGQILDYLEVHDLMDNTTVFYMGDNGFSFGEHGLIDKRQAYEESMRVPLLAMGAAVSKSVKVVEQNVQNIDIGPTILDIAGVGQAEQFDGQSFLPLLQSSDNTDWRDTIYYEYFWERPFPQTPTVHAIRTQQYKYIRYHGIWDINELYDLTNDPLEANNLIRSKEHQAISRDLRNSLFKWLAETEGEQMYLRKDGNYGRFDEGKDVNYSGTF